MRGTERKQKLCGNGFLRGTLEQQKLCGNRFVTEL